MQAHVGVQYYRLRGEIEKREPTRGGSQEDHDCLWLVTQQLQDKNEKSVLMRAFHDTERHIKNIQHIKYILYTN